MIESRVPDEVVWYVLGVARPGPPGLASAPTLLPGRPLEAVMRAGICAVACTVPADLLDEERTAEDLGRLARAHDRVLRAIARQATVVPARLGSLYPSRQAVESMLDSRQEQLNATLDQVSGRAEWGVKVYVEPLAAAGQEPQAGTAPPPTAPPPTAPTGAPGGTPQAGTAQAGSVRTGTAYLRRKSAERQRRTSDRQALATLVADLHRAVAAHADAAVARPPQPPGLSGVRAQMLLNGAYLVEKARERAFTAAVGDHADGLHQKGLRVEITGPWLPYSFAGQG